MSRALSPSSRRSVGILGLGFMGSSLGLALRRRGMHVRGWDRNGEHQKASFRRTAVTELAEDMEELGACEVVVLAVPPSAVVPALRKLGPHLGSKTLILDLASVRRGLQAEAASHLGLSARRWIGSHPMTGSERSGPSSAQADLFQGASVLLVPPPRVENEALGQAKAFWLGLGARPAILDEKVHDRIMALVSHGPHVMAAALVLALPKGKEPEVWAGPGFRDTTRVAAGDPGLWTDILRRNSPELRAQIRRLKSALISLDLALKNPSPSRLRGLLSQAALRRQKIQ